RPPWNHNIHYHAVVLGTVPDGTGQALDIGCGEGMLARELRRLVPNVVAIDLDQASIDLAEAHDGDIDYVLGDFLTHPFKPASFDVIVSVAALHHMDATTALGRMRDLLRPGGVLTVVGLARSEYLADLPADLAGAVAHRFHALTKSHWEHPSPTVWPPPETYAGMRRLAAQVLPGARFRRHLLWRYSLTWLKPA
ncbi:MAG: class I SAM-dependent methyltransferase, partial [Egibacteraceae bacterium]